MRHIPWLIPDCGHSNWIMFTSHLSLVPLLGSTSHFVHFVFGMFPLNIPSTWSIDDVFVFCLLPSPRAEILLPFVDVSPRLLEGHLKHSGCSGHACWVKMSASSTGLCPFSPLCILMREGKAQCLFSNTYKGLKLQNKNVHRSPRIFESDSMLDINIWVLIKSHM